MTSLVLVHGAWRGSWLWQRVRSSLSSGHTATAINTQQHDAPLDRPAEVVEILIDSAGT
jgi:hypothetical protein